MIWVQNQLVGAQEGESVTLECMSEAYPKSIYYWTKNKTTIVSNGECVLKKQGSKKSNIIVLLFSVLFYFDFVNS